MDIPQYGLIPTMSQANSANAYTNASWQQGFDNLFTGNLDYARNLYMSNSAYQRAANDMSNVGLNPMLMYSGGSASAASSNAGGGAGKGFASLGQFMTALLGSALKVATTSMISEAQANQIILKNDLVGANIEKMNSAKLAGTYDPAKAQIYKKIRKPWWTDEEYFNYLDNKSNSKDDNLVDLSKIFGDNRSK